MKRKKSPIALISVLVVACLGLVIAGPGFAFFSKSAQEQQSELQRQAVEAAKARADKTPVGKVDGNKAVQDMKANLKQKGGGLAPRDPNKAEAQPAMSEVPTMFMPDDKVNKPQPNTAAPSSQWYGDKK